jgi:hypothetical protein
VLGVALLGTSLLVPLTPAVATNNIVVPINFSGFATTPTDALSVQVGQVLSNATKYAVTTWWNTTENYDSQSGSQYLNFGGSDEAHIRPGSAEAAALSTSIRLGQYNPTLTGVPLATARAETEKLIASLAHAHYSNTAGGWGTSVAPTSSGTAPGWQTAEWAAQTALAGWIFWDYLTTAEQTLVRNLVEAEANRFIGWTVPYYRNLAGTLLTPGDSKAEEVAWDGNILQVATAMLPNDANYSTWMQKRLEVSLASYSRPADLAGTSGATVVNGHSLSYWLKGSNNYDDATLVNHSIVHPDYMLFPIETGLGVVTQSLARKSTPYADVRGGLYYKALVDQPWTPGPKPAEYNIDSTVTRSVASPGGAIYHSTDTTATNFTDIYYPMGDDWGPATRINYLTMDVVYSSVSTQYGELDSLASSGGAHWGPYHAAKILNMQARFTDGHTYLNAGEQSYAGREEQVAQDAAESYLIRFLAANVAISVSNGSF